MNLLKWQDEYSVGVKKFDDQHKKMFNIINGLYHSIEDAKDQKFKSDLFDELNRYGSEHLAAEEKYFDKYDYPKKEEHKRMHDAYRERIKEFMNQEYGIVLSMDILDYLEDWWVGHITSTDQDYKEFFKDKGVN